MADGPGNTRKPIQASVSQQSAALGRLVEPAYPELRSIALRYFEARAGQPDPGLHRTDQRSLPPPGAGVRTGLEGSRPVLRGGRPGDARDPGPAAAIDVLDLHDALDELEQSHPRPSRVVALRYFGGLSMAECAAAMGVSLSSARREWTVAKTWIHRRLLGLEPRNGARPR